MFKLVILVVAVLKLSSGSCPHGCNCSEEQLLCMDIKLESIPNLALLDNAPKVIDFSGNKLTFINAEDFSFERNEMVQEIFLNNSEIVGIDRDAFEEIENLQELYLGQNLLNGVSEFIIEPLDSVVVLDLSNNYFNGDMPVIRSKSLEVLAMANSKVSSVPKEALRHLPNLKLLLLQQNNIKTISLEAFDAFKAGSMMVKLSQNPWECSCANLDLFQMLKDKNFIDASELYQCKMKNGSFVDIFEKNGAFSGDTSDCAQGYAKRKMVTKQLSSEFSDFKDVRAMVNEKKGERVKLVLEKSIDDEIYDTNTSGLELDTFNETHCLDLPSLFLIKFKSDNRYFVVLLIAVVLGFLIGFLTGILSIKILYINRYQKLAQDSESTSKLVFNS